MQDLLKMLGPLLPFVIVVGGILAVVLCFTWLLAHPLVLVLVVAFIGACVFVLIKGKYIGSNRV